MTYSIKEILRKAIKTAKESGTWQSFSLHEKKVMVDYFQNNYDNLHRDAVPRRRMAIRAMTVFV